LKKVGVAVGLKFLFSRSKHWEGRTMMGERTASDAGEQAVDPVSHINHLNLLQKIFFRPITTGPEPVRKLHG
jgi:hypothetical protein